MLVVIAESLGAEFVNRSISGECDDPSGNIATISEVEWGFLPDKDEYFLKNILGIFFGTQHVQKEGIDAWGKTVVKFAECFFVAIASDAFEKKLVSLVCFLAAKLAGLFGGRGCFI